MSSFVLSMPLVFSDIFTRMPPMKVRQFRFVVACFNGEAILPTIS